MPAAAARMRSARSAAASIAAFGMSAASRSPEIRADSALAGKAFAMHSATLDDHVVAHVHAEGLVDDVQAVDVEIQNAVRGRSAADGEQRCGLALERVASHEPGARHRTAPG